MNMIREKGRLRRIILAGMPLGAVFALSTATFPEPSSADGIAPATIRGTCEVAFLATSTLHDVSGSARCLPFAAVLTRDAVGRQVIPTVEAEVPVEGMDTRNKTRDGKMREMFLSERFPRIHASAQEVDVERLRVELGKGPEGIASIDLLLRIRDMERKVRATASNLKESGDRVGDKVSVKASFTLTVARRP